MPAGSNAYGNLNLLLFEVVATTRYPPSDITRVTTVGIHPLVRVPSLIQYTSNSRTSVVQTVGGSQVTPAPRGFSQVKLAGNWGVESVGLLPYIGTGEVRARRFYDEVVRLSDAIDKEDVNSCINVLTGTPFVKLLLAPYFESPDNTSFAINFYDLWNQRQFQCLIRSYSDTRSFRNGGATGNIGYQMAVEEVGPVVTGSGATDVILALANALGIWSDVNAVLESYTAQSIINAGFGVAGILTSQLERSKDAVVGQLEAMTAIFSGAGNSQNEGLSSFFQDIRDLGAVADEIMAQIAPTLVEVPDAPRGGVDFGSPAADLSTYRTGPTTPSDAALRTPRAVDPAAFSTEFVVALDQADAVAGLEELSEAAAFQAAAPKFYGLDRGDAEVIASRSRFRPTLSARGSRRHLVSDLDTEESIEARYGVRWDDVLAFNAATPDEALVAGRYLLIPSTRASGAAAGRRIEGLPVLGSHLGRAAWGADLRVDLRVASSGDLDTVTEADALVQGVDWLVEDAQDQIVAFANALPVPGREIGIAQRVRPLLLQDPRIESVDEIVVEIDASAAAMSIRTTLSAINGGTISTGGA